MEVWRPVDAYPRYEVSNLGRVRSDRGVLSPWKDGTGRPTVRLYRDGAYKTIRVQKLVLNTFVGPRPSGKEACHRDGDPENNALSNLRWDTKSSNTKDSVRHGTHVQARKDQCPRGHELVDWNLTPAQLRLGRRACLACSRAIRLKYYYAQAGQSIDIQALSDQKFQELVASRATLI